MLTNSFIALVFLMIDFCILGMVLNLIYFIISGNPIKAIRIFVADFVVLIISACFITAMFLGGSPKQFLGLYFIHAQKAIMWVTEQIPIKSSYKNKLKWIVKETVDMAKEVVGPFTSPHFTFFQERSTTPIEQLKKFLVQQRTMIETQKLLKYKQCGDERFLAPDFLILKLNPEYILAPNDYAKKAWLITLYSWAIDIAIRSGKLQEYQESPIYEKIVKFFLEKLKEVSELNKSQLSSRLPTLRDEIGRFLRNEFVARGVFKSNRATFRESWDRPARLTTGLLIAVEGIVGVSEVRKAELLANSPVVFKCLKRLVYFLKKTKIYNNDLALQRAINEYHLASNCWLSNPLIEEEMTLGNLYLIAFVLPDVSTAIGGAVGTVELPGIGTVPGAVIGAIFGIAASKALSISLDQLKEGIDFSLYYDITSRLFTLAFSSERLKKKDEIFYYAYSLYLALKWLDTHVIGKGIPSKIGLMLGGEEARWKEYLNTYFYPQEAKVEINLYKIMESQLVDIAAP